MATLGFKFTHFLKELKEHSSSGTTTAILSRVCPNVDEVFFFQSITNTEFRLMTQTDKGLFSALPLTYRWGN